MWPGWRVPTLGDAPRPHARSCHVAWSSQCPGQRPSPSRVQTSPLPCPSAPHRFSDILPLSWGPSRPLAWSLFRQAFVKLGGQRLVTADGTGPCGKPAPSPGSPWAGPRGWQLSVCSALGPPTVPLLGPYRRPSAHPTGHRLRFAFSEVVLSRQSLVTFVHRSPPWLPIAAV